MSCGGIRDRDQWFPCDRQHRRLIILKNTNRRCWAGGFFYAYDSATVTTCQFPRSTGNRPTPGRHPVRPTTWFMDCLHGPIRVPASSNSNANESFGLPGKLSAMCRISLKRAISLRSSSSMHLCLSCVMKTATYAGSTTFVATGQRGCSTAQPTRRTVTARAV